MSPDHRRGLRLVRMEYPEPATSEENLEYARALLERLHGASVAELKEVEGGACDDCGRESRRRWRLGRLTVCRVCGAARVRVGKAVAA